MFCCLGLGFLPLVSGPCELALGTRLLVFGIRVWGFCILTWVPGPGPSYCLFVFGVSIWALVFVPWSLALGPWSLVLGVGLWYW